MKFKFKKWLKAGTTFYDVYFGDMKMGTIHLTGTGRGTAWTGTKTDGTFAFGRAMTRIDAARLFAGKFAA